MSAPWDPDPLDVQCDTCRAICPLDDAHTCPTCDEYQCFDCITSHRHECALVEAATTRAEGPPHESHPSGPIHESQPSEGPPVDPAAVARPLPAHIQWPLEQAMAWVSPEFRPSLVALVRCAYTQGRSDGLTACASLIDAHTQTVSKL